MYTPGIGELVIIFVIVLVIFGAGKLPQIGSGLGEAIRNFKKSTQESIDDNSTPGKVDNKENKELNDKEAS